VCENRVFVCSNVAGWVRIVSAWFVELVDMVIGILAMLLYRYCVCVLGCVDVVEL